MPVICSFTFPPEFGAHPACQAWPPSICRLPCRRHALGLAIRRYKRHELAHLLACSSNAAGRMAQPIVKPWRNGNVEPARAQATNTRPCARCHDKYLARPRGHTEPSSLSSGAPLCHEAARTPDKGNCMQSYLRRLTHLPTHACVLQDSFAAPPNTTEWHNTRPFANLPMTFGIAPCCPPRRYAQGCIPCPMLAASGMAIGSAWRVRMTIQLVRCAYHRSGTIDKHALLLLLLLLLDLPGDVLVALLLLAGHADPSSRRRTNGRSPFGYGTAPNYPGKRWRLKRPGSQEIHW